MKKTVNQLTLVYYGFYALAIAFAAIGYSFFSGKEALIPEQSSDGTVIMSVYILFLVASIPLALKLFSMKVKKLAELETPEEKLSRYKIFSLWRLVIVGCNLLFGIGFFYLMNSRSMIYCAAIAAVALVFCKPSEVKMTVELGLDED